MFSSWNYFHVQHTADLKSDQCIVWLEARGSPLHCECITSVCPIHTAQLWAIQEDVVGCNPRSTGGVFPMCPVGVSVGGGVLLEMQWISCALKGTYGRNAPCPSEQNHLLKSIFMLSFYVSGVVHRLAGFYQEKHPILWLSGADITVTSMCRMFGESHFLPAELQKFNTLTLCLMYQP